MLAPFCKQPLDVTLRGITNNDIDPSVDLIKSSLISTMKLFIHKRDGLDVIIKKRGKKLQYRKNLHLDIN